MNQLLGDLDYVTVYIDDIVVIKKKDKPDSIHLINLQQFWTSLNTQGLLLT